MNVPARNGRVELVYERVGTGAGEPLLLVSGLGMQLTFWPDGLLERFGEAGFDVARFDNRDVGRSTALRELGVPPLRRMLTRPRSVAPTCSPTWPPTPSPSSTRWAGSRHTCSARRWAG